MDKWPDTGKTIVTNKERPSNIWTRGVYYEGLMALHEIDPKQVYYDYAYSWSEFHNWGFRNGNANRNADDYCAAQTYIDLYNIEPDPKKLKNTRQCINMLLNTPQLDDWSWIDAIQMGMPVFAKLGVLDNDNRYYEKMYDMYMYSRDKHGDNGLYNPKDGLWWRDADFDPPYKEPNGEDCYWSRGNGWVIAALAKVLTIIPENAPHRGQYVSDLKAMAKEFDCPVIALAQLNRESEKGKRPKASDLKESGQIEQDADQILLAHPILNADDEMPSGVTEIIVAKNRHGKKGVVRVLDRLDICRFASIRTEDEALGGGV